MNCSLEVNGRSIFQQSQEVSTKGPVGLAGVIFAGLSELQIFAVYFGRTNGLGRGRTL
jgi:hypothetical protein